MGTYGGGVYYDNSSSVAEGSTIAGNIATTSGGGFYWTGQGPLGMTNCIIFDNSAPANTNYPQANFYGAYYCCTTPLPLSRFGRGYSNITNDPSFVNAPADNFRLSSNSPCINSGNNAVVAGAVDLDGNPRIVGGLVDIGAYEYQTPVSMTPYIWLERYGLPITNGIDTSHPNGTAFDVYQDWAAGLNPTNSASVLAMLKPASTINTNGITVTWQSIIGLPYFLQRSTNLPAFVTIQSNISGQTNTTTYTDSSATNNFPYLYRVGVTAP